MEKNISSKEYALIMLVAMIVWSPIIFTSFINDDFQILSWHSNTTFLSLLKPFISKDVSGYYWRPLGNTLHTITILLFGFKPFAFRLGNLLLYAFCCALIARTGMNLGFSKRVALTSSLIFAVLPAHEILIGWIAAKGEILVAIFILLCADYYNRALQNKNMLDKYLTSFIFFITALLIKELAFILVLLPFLFLFSLGDFSSSRLRKASLHSIIGLFSIVGILLIRFLLLGNNPFASPHFSSANPFGWLLNLLLFLPLSFVTPEILEKLYTSLNSIVFIIVLILITVPTLIFIAKGMKKMIKEERYQFAFSSLWFIIFIIPVAPVLMRWYPFTASIGLVWLIAGCIEKIDLLEKLKSLRIVLFLSLVLGLGVYDFYISLNWYHAGKRMDRIVMSIKGSDELHHSKDILLLAVPDKYNNVPLMKLGVQQTFEYALNKKNIEVFSPLRITQSEDSKIELIQYSKNHYRLQAVNGKFYAEGKSREIGAGSENKYDVSGVRLVIRNYRSYDTSRISEAEVFIDSKYENYFRAYYNGDKFVRADSILQ